MLIIPQAKPQSGYFKVFVPGNTEVHHRDKVQCKDPVSGARVNGVCMSIITIEWSKVPQWVCFETYGMDAEGSRAMLGESVPAFGDEEKIKILIIKQN